MLLALLEESIGRIFVAGTLEALSVRIIRLIINLSIIFYQLALKPKILEFAHSLVWCCITRAKKEPIFVKNV